MKSAISLVPVRSSDGLRQHWVILHAMPSSIVSLALPFALWWLQRTFQPQLFLDPRAFTIAIELLMSAYLLFVLLFFTSWLITPWMWVVTTSACSTWCRPVCFTARFQS